MLFFKNIKKRIIKSKMGFGLIEVLIATAILGILVVGLVGSLSSASRALILNDSRQTAKNWAETQMEFIKNQPYSFSYSSSPALPPPPSEGYTSTITVSTLPGKGANIQKITIAVTHNNKLSYTLEGYKAN
jgi:prepilin-type N-terminal cleavage/methylation domain-containing protein